MTVKPNDSGPSNHNPQSVHIIQLVLSVPDDLQQAALSGQTRIRTDCVGFPEVRIPWSAFQRHPTGNPAD